MVGYTPICCELMIWVRLFICFCKFIKCGCEFDLYPLVVFSRLHGECRHGVTYRKMLPRRTRKITVTSWSVQETPFLDECRSLPVQQMMSTRKRRSMRRRLLLLRDEMIMVTALRTDDWLVVSTYFIHICIWDAYARCCLGADDDGQRMSPPKTSWSSSSSSLWCSINDIQSGGTDESSTLSVSVVTASLGYASRMLSRPGLNCKLVLLCVCLAFRHRIIWKIARGLGRTGSGLEETDDDCMLSEMIRGDPLQNEQPCSE